MAVTLNYRPHRAQQLIHDARDTRFRVVCTGRRFGKTLCLAGELLDRGALAPGDYGWIAPTYNVAERGKEALRDIAGGFVRFVGRTPARLFTFFHHLEFSLNPFQLILWLMFSTSLLMLSASI